MNYKTLIIRLYYMMVYADGTINENERRSANQLIAAEAIAEEDFRVQMELIKSRDKISLLSECLLSLKKLARTQQVRSIAWLCVFANADGFMDKAEWKLIYKLYHNELNLSLDEILIDQKQLSNLNLAKSLKSTQSQFLN